MVNNKITCGCSGFLITILMLIITRLNLFLDSINNKLLIFLLVFFTTTISIGLGSIFDLFDNPKPKKSKKKSQFSTNEDFITHK